jgi:hypothetical protein
MTKLACIDIDRVCANGDARFALAEQAKQQVFALNGTNRDAMDAYWRTAFTAEYIALDTLIDGCYDALNVLEDDHYDLIFLTSRPEQLRKATRDWLNQYRIGMGRDLVMKPAINQFHKTREWKVWAIHLLAGMYGASEVLVIEDESANLDELARHAAPFKIRAYPSLEMKEIVGNDLDDIRPF